MKYEIKVTHIYNVSAKTLTTDMLNSRHLSGCSNFSAYSLKQKKISLKMKIMNFSFNHTTFDLILKVYFKIISFYLSTYGIVRSTTVDIQIKVNKYLLSLPVPLQIFYNAIAVSAELDECDLEKLSVAPVCFCKVLK